MVCERELSVVVDRSAQTSNWSRRPLCDDQLKYAALDPEVLLALYDRFKLLGVTTTEPGGPLMELSTLKQGDPDVRDTPD